MGLVTASVPADEVDEVVLRYARALVRGAPAALAATKVLLRRDARPIRDELAELTRTSVGFFTSAEGREGVASFVAKRDPYWVVSDLPPR